MVKAKPPALNSNARDYLTEMLVGHDGAVRTVGKMIVQRTGTMRDGLVLTALFGSVYYPSELVIPENLGYREMWEGEFILIPRRKYSSCDSQGKDVSQYSGYRADQVLCSNFGNPENWGRKYWEVKDDQSQAETR